MQLIKINLEQILNSLNDDKEIIPEDIAQWWSNYLASHKSHYRELFSIIKETSKDSKILEIGSVPGHFTTLMKKQGFKIEGVDIEPNRLEKFWLKHQIKIHKVNVETETLPFESNSFDLIIFSEILEHLRINPIKPLLEINRILKTNGRLILSTPNVTPIMKLDFLFNNESFQGNPVKEFEKLETLGHMGHIRLYSLPEIKSILKHVNLVVKSVSYGDNISKPTLKQNFLLSLLKIFGFKYSRENLHSKVYIIAEKKT